MSDDLYRSFISRGDLIESFGGSLAAQRRASGHGVNPYRVAALIVSG